MEKGDKTGGKTLGEDEPELDFDFYVDEKNRQIIMTERGLQKAQDLFEVDNLYSLEHASKAHHLRPSHEGSIYL